MNHGCITLAVCGYVGRPNSNVCCWMVNCQLYQFTYLLDGDQILTFDNSRLWTAIVFTLCREDSCELLRMLTGSSIFNSPRCDWRPLIGHRLWWRHHKRHWCWCNACYRHIVRASWRLCIIKFFYCSKLSELRYWQIRTKQLFCSEISILFHLVSKYQTRLPSLHLVTARASHSIFSTMNAL